MINLFYVNLVKIIFNYPLTPIILIKIIIRFVKDHGIVKGIKQQYD